MISDGRTFKYTTKKTILNRYVDDNGDQLGEKVLKKYEKYQD